ncbi:MAG: RNA pseudouridine synthase, partial [Deltaproteobacteria bacterium]|nr:RNA pseudouridine synthase [Deltaproteobacteria bacterium]
MTVTSPLLNSQVQPIEKGMRLDHYLVRYISDQSRSSLGKYIRSGHILVNNTRVKPGYRLSTGDDILVELPVAVESRLVAQQIDFKVLYEDESLLVISKPSGLVVHPAAGHADSTLVNGLPHRYGDLPGLEMNRPGIVHRL